MLMIVMMMMVICSKSLFARIWTCVFAILNLAPYYVLCILDLLLPSSERLLLPIGLQNPSVWRQRFPECRPCIHTWWVETIFSRLDLNIPKIFSRLDLNISKIFSRLDLNIPSKNRVWDGRLHFTSYLVPRRPRLAETVCPAASNPLLVDNIPDFLDFLKKKNI